MSKAPAYVFAVITLDGCIACTALKKVGEIDKYAAMCRELGNIEFRLVDVPKVPSSTQSYPPFLDRVVTAFPTIMLIEMRGQRWGPNLDARALGSVYVLNGQWNGPDNQIGPNPNGAARVSRVVSEVKRWVESILIAQQRGRVGGGAQVPIMVRSSPSAPTPAPTGSASASNARSSVYRPVPSDRTLSTFTGNQMVRQFHNRY